VTGASGFIGRNLLLRIPEEWDVVATYNKSEDFVRFVAQNALHNVHAVKVDLTNPSQTKKKLGKMFDYGICLAANTDWQLFLKSPAKDLQMTAQTLLNTLEAAKIENLVFVSSGAVYNGLTGPVSPGMRLNPSSPHAIAKLACEKYVAFFKKVESIDRYVILRLFGAYGPFEPPRKIFTKLVKAFYFEKQKEFAIVGDGNNLIDALYVDDVVKAILSVLRSDVGDVTVDLSSGKPRTINALVHNMAEIFGLKNVNLKHEGCPAGYIKFQSSDRSMETLFGFKPSTTLEVGIWKLAKWLKKKYA